MVRLLIVGITIAFVLGLSGGLFAAQTVKGGKMQYTGVRPTKAGAHKETKASHKKECVRYNRVGNLK